MLYKLIKKILNKYHPDIIGVLAGREQVGASKAIYTVLSGRFNVLSGTVLNDELDILSALIGRRNKNNFWSRFSLFFHVIKILIFRQANYPDIIILEINLNKLDNIENLIKKFPPKVIICNGVDDLLVSTFGNIKKAGFRLERLINNLPESSIAVLNFDDEVVKSFKTKSKIISYALNNSATIRASEPIISVGSDNGINGLSFKFNHEGSIVPVLMPEGLGQNNAYIALMATGCGLIFQMNLTEIVENLKKNIPQSGRLRVLKGIKNTIIIDDTYDSSFDEVKNAISVLATIPLKLKGKKYAVIGDLNGLGGQTESLHQEIGRYVHDMSVDMLVTIGEKAKDVAITAKSAGISEDRVFSFADNETAGRFIQDRLKENDIILVSGSSIMRLESMVKEIMAEPLLAKDLLVNRE